MPTTVPIDFTVSALDVSTGALGQTWIDFLVMNTGGPDLSCTQAWLYLYDSAGNEVAEGEANSRLDDFLHSITLPLAQWTPLSATIDGQPTWASFRVDLSGCREDPEASHSRLFAMTETETEPLVRDAILTATAHMVNVSGRPCDWVTYYAVLYDQEGRLVSINRCGSEKDVPAEPVPIDCLVDTEPGVEPRIEWIVQGRWYPDGE